MKHTNAPWAVVPTIDGRTVIAKVNDNNEVESEIAEMVVWKDKEEQIGNTILISEAPAMRDALKEIFKSNRIDVIKEIAKIALSKVI